MCKSTMNQDNKIYVGYSYIHQTWDSTSTNIHVDSLRLHLGCQVYSVACLCMTGQCSHSTLLHIQIRLMGGGALTHTFSPSDTLVDVNQHILMNQDTPNTPFLLMTNFPKKVFSPSDMRKTLRELGRYYTTLHPKVHDVNSSQFSLVAHAGLVPSAVLIQTKP